MYDLDDEYIVLENFRVHRKPRRIRYWLPYDYYFNSFNSIPQC